LGCVGLVAWKAGRPVGYAWIAREMRPEVSLYPLELPVHAAYLWDLYVVPAERGNGLGSSLAAERLRTARELGFTEGWRMVAPDNIASLRTLRRTGLQPRVVGEVRCLKLGPRLFGRFTPCPPPTH
jgi:GNAT superfamily N-acetyltransferase